LSINFKTLASTVLEHICYKFSAKVHHTGVQHVWAVTWPKVWHGCTSRLKHQLRSSVGQEFIFLAYNLFCGKQSIFLPPSIDCVDTAQETKCSVVYIIINSHISCRETTKAGGLYRDWV